MKFRTYLLGMTIALMPCVLTSCGDDDPVKPDTTNPTDDPTDKTLTPAEEVWESKEQKEYLEDVALELNGMMPVGDFRPYIDLAKYIDETYIDQYDWDGMEDWAEDILDDLLSDLISTSQKDGYSNSYTGGDGITHTYIYQDIYSHYKSTVLASNFKGHWTARNGKWQYTDADDIQFIFKNQSGQECVLKLTTSGNVAKVHLMDLDDWGDYSTEYDGNTIIYKDYIDRTAYTIGVPENIEVTLTEGGKELIKQTVATKLGSITNEEFDLSKGTLDFSSLTTFSNGYEIKVKNVKYSSTAASAETAVNKNGKTLLTVTASSNLKGAPRNTLTDWYNMDDDEIEDALSKSTAEGAFSVNVLGKVQIVGKVTDAHKLFDYLDEADDNDKNEQKFKTAIANANKYYEANIYYNGGKAKQAYLSLTPIADHYTSWNGERNTYWDAEATINFPDGTSYSVESYFNEDDFKDLIDAIEKQSDDAEDLWD